MPSPRITLRVHAIERMFEREISMADITALVERGEAIERRPDDTPFPSRLVHLKLHGRHLHAVLADNIADDEVFVVSLYEPDPALWDRTFTRRMPR
jgi:hypothetical protein